MLAKTRVLQQEIHNEDNSQFFIDIDSHVGDI